MSLRNNHYTSSRIPQRYPTAGLLALRLCLHMWSIMAAAVFEATKRSKDEYRVGDNYRLEEYTTVARNLQSKVERISANDHAVRVPERQ